MPKQMTVEEFIKMYSGKWHLNNLCPDCGKITTNPLKNFVDCYLDLGIEGNDKLRQACLAYQKSIDGLWGEIDCINFEFIEEE